MAIRPDIVDEDVMEDQIYVLPENEYGLSYSNKVAVKLMYGRWRRALFIRKIMDSYVKVFFKSTWIMDWDEDVMENQIYSNIHHFKLKNL